VRVLAILIVVVALSHASHADDLADARAEFAAGQQADKDQDYQEAINHYQIANKLKTHPFTIYNIAVDFERLNQLREAARWYQDYLDHAPPSPERDKVARELPGLRTRPSNVVIRSLPPGARVRIDNKNAGTTPLNIVLPGGAHHIVADRDADHDERDQTLEYGEPADVMFTFHGTPGTLYVYGVPAGAQVAIDNLPSGVLPATLQVEAGPHTVRVTAEGYAPYEAGVTVSPNQTTQVEARMQSNLGTIDTQTGPKIPVSYVIGGAGGVAFSNGNTSMALAKIGARAFQWEAGFRFGTTGGSEFDLYANWYLFNAVVSPFFSGAIDIGGIGTGYEFDGGLRWDVARGDKLGFAIMASFGVRVYKGMQSSDSVDSAIYPLSFAAEINFR
jgi:PEGA domain